MSLEKRTLIRPLEVRAGNSGRTVGGYAAVFGSTVDIGGHFREVIASGAFSEAVNGDVLALYDHDMGRVIGRSSAGTLRLSEDETGLAVEIDLPDTSDGRDLATLIERGDIKGMSFGFIVTKQEWDETGDVPTRTIQKVELIEVSAVARPAYSDTSIGMRSLEEARKEQRQQNNDAAARRIAERRAKAEQRFRRIS